MTTFRRGAKRFLIRGREVLSCSAKDFFVDDGLHWAAAIAFYGILSIFPLILAGVSIARFFVDAQWATQRASNLLGQFIPQGERTIRTVVETAFSKGGRTGLVSVIVLLIPARAFFPRSFAHSMSPTTSTKFTAR